MKKLFGRDKVKQQKVISHRDVDVVIDDVSLDLQGNNHLCHNLDHH